MQCNSLNGSNQDIKAGNMHGKHRTLVSYLRIAFRFETCDIDSKPDIRDFPRASQGLGGGVSTLGGLSNLFRGEEALSTKTGRGEATIELSLINTNDQPQGSSKG